MRKFLITALVFVSGLAYGQSPQKLGSASLPVYNPGMFMADSIILAFPPQDTTTVKAAFPTQRMQGRTGWQGLIPFVLDRNGNAYQLDKRGRVDSLYNALNTGKEDKGNKVQVLSSANNITYPSSIAVRSYVDGVTPSWNDTTKTFSLINSISGHYNGVIRLNSLADSLSVDSLKSQLQSKHILYVEDFGVIPYDSSESVTVANRYNIQRAVDSVAAVHGLLIGTKTYYHDSTIIVKGDYHDYVISGNGTGEFVLKSRPNDTFERFGWLYMVDSTDMSSPHDITFRDMTLNGNRYGNQNLIAVINPVTAGGTGLNFRTNRIDANFRVYNVIFKNWLGNGINMIDGTNIVSDCYFLDNRESGLDLNPPGSMIASNIYTYSNRNGIDCSGGRMQLTNATCYKDEYGMKTSEDVDYFQGDNISILQSDFIGFRQTNTADSATVQVGKMRIEGCGWAGIEVDTGKNNYYADLTLINNNSTNVSPYNNRLHNAHVGRLYIEEYNHPPSEGLEASGNVIIDEILAKYNTSDPIIRVSVDNYAHLTINGGLFIDNYATAIKNTLDGNILTLNNIVFKDTTSAFRSVHMTGATKNYISNCNFVAKPSPKVDPASVTTYLRVSNNIGLDNSLLNLTAATTVKNEKYITLGTPGGNRVLTLPDATIRKDDEPIVIWNQNTISSRTWSFGSNVYGADGVAFTNIPIGMIMSLRSDGTKWYVVTSSTGVTVQQTTLTGSGNGSSTAISVALPYAATWVMVGAKNAASAGITYWTVSGTTLTINYATAPTSGTNNLSYWVEYK